MDTTAIIAALGGPRAVAQIVARDESRIIHWKREGIPARHWPALVAAAQGRLTYEILAASHGSDPTHANNAGSSHVASTSVDVIASGALAHRGGAE